MKLFLIENAYEYEQGCKNQRDDNTPVDGILYLDFFLHNIKRILLSIIVTI